MPSLLCRLVPNLACVSGPMVYCCTPNFIMIGAHLTNFAIIRSSCFHFLHRSGSNLARGLCLHAKFQPDQYIRSPRQSKKHDLYEILEAPVPTPLLIRVIFGVHVCRSMVYAHMPNFIRSVYSFALGGEKHPVNFTDFLTCGGATWRR